MAEPNEPQNLVEAQVEFSRWDSASDRWLLLLVLVGGFALLFILLPTGQSNEGDAHRSLSLDLAAFYLALVLIVVAVWRRFSTCVRRRRVAARWLTFWEQRLGMVETKEMKLRRRREGG